MGPLNGSDTLLILCTTSVSSLSLLAKESNIILKLYKKLVEYLLIVFVAFFFTGDHHTVANSV